MFHSFTHLPTLLSASVVSAPEASAAAPANNIFQQAVAFLPDDYAWVFLALMGLGVAVACLQVAVLLQVRQSGEYYLPARALWLSVFWVPGLFILLTLLWQVSMAAVLMLVGAVALVWVADVLFDESDKK